MRDVLFSFDTYCVIERQAYLVDTLHGNGWLVGLGNDRYWLVIGEAYNPG